MCSSKRNATISSVADEAIDFARDIESNSHLVEMAIEQIEQQHQKALPRVLTLLVQFRSANESDMEHLLWLLEQLQQQVKGGACMEKLLPGVPVPRFRLFQVVQRKHCTSKPSKLQIRGMNWEDGNGELIRRGWWYSTGNDSLIHESDLERCGDR